MVIRALVHEIEGTACRYRRCGRPSGFFDVQSELSSWYIILCMLLLYKYLLLWGCDVRSTRCLPVVAPSQYMYTHLGAQLPPCNHSATECGDGSGQSVHGNVGHGGWLRRRDQISA